ncbi:MAG: hypothetical protein ACE5HI_02755 [bacterium]
MNSEVQFEAVEIFTNFLAGHPTDEEILNFKFPQQVQDRIQELVIKNNAGMIDENELIELREYERLDTYGRLLKTKIAMRQKEAKVTA